METVLTTVLAGVVVLLVAKIGQLVWRVAPRLKWRFSRWWENKRHAREVRRNESVVLANGENRHRGCVRRGEEIDEQKSRTHVPLGRCTVCGAHPRSPRNKSGASKTRIDR